jgi:hypothetical protein
MVSQRPEIEHHRGLQTDTPPQAGLKSSTPLQRGSRSLAWQAHSNREASPSAPHGGLKLKACYSRVELLQLSCHTEGTDRTHGRKQACSCTHDTKQMCATLKATQQHINTRRHEAVDPASVIARGCDVHRQPQGGVQSSTSPKGGMR